MRKSRWRIFKEKPWEYQGRDRKWVVWDPDFNESLFFTYLEAAAFVNGRITYCEWVYRLAHPHD